MAARAGLTPELRAEFCWRDTQADCVGAGELARESYWSATRPVELTAAIGQHAGDLARTHALRGADAVHLASALAIGGADLIFAVWDRRLHADAHAVGLRVAPAELGP